MFINELEDLFGFRFLTERLDDTYKIADILIQACGLAECASPEWENKQQIGFMDWIQQPRQNGFRSLDYFVQTQGGFSVNVQGRTYGLEQDNEAGLGAHQLYKKMQLNSFQMRCFTNSAYRERVIVHASALLDSFHDGYRALDTIQPRDYPGVLRLFSDVKNIGLVVGIQT